MTYYESLINKYEELLDKKSSSIEYVITLARLYLKTNNVDKALSFYEALPCTSCLLHFALPGSLHNKAAVPL